MNDETLPGSADYVGFWMRFVAFLIDSIVVSIVIVPLLAVFYGWDLAAMSSGSNPVWDFLIQIVLPAVAVILFWRYKGATPGKMLIAAKIVDAQDRATALDRQAGCPIHCVFRFLLHAGDRLRLDRDRPQEAGVSRQDCRHAGGPRQGTQNDRSLYMAHAQRAQSPHHAGGNRHPVPRASGQHRRGRAVRAGLPQDFAEQQDAGDDRHGGPRRQAPVDVRIRRDAHLSRLRRAGASCPKTWPRNGRPCRG